MSKLLVICFPCLFLLTGCVKDESEFIFTDMIILKNEIQCPIHFYFEMTNLFKDSLLVETKDSVFSSTTQTVSAKSFYAATTKIPINGISVYELYDLIDTMSYRWCIDNDSVLTIQNSKFIEHIDKYSETVKKRATAN